MNRRKTVLDIIEEFEKESKELTEEILEQFERALNEVRDLHSNRVYGSADICLVQEPAIQVEETENEILITVDMPFVKPQNVSLRLVKDLLRVEALTERRVNGGCIILRTVIPLSNPVIKEESTARFLNGKLRVHLKKKRRTTHISVE
jgi:HSP20 family molecular chaperone IbpA